MNDKKRMNLQKGEVASLPPHVKKIVVGLGWDIPQNQNIQMDLDASCVLINQEGEVDEVVCFHHLKSEYGCVVHRGDNLTGEGSGDDEQLIVNLDKVPSHIENLVFLVNIYCGHLRGQHFGQLNNAFVRLVAGRSELMRFSLSQGFEGMVNMSFIAIFRQDDGWKVRAMGEGSKQYSAEVEERVSSFSKLWGTIGSGVNLVIAGLILFGFIWLYSRFPRKIDLEGSVLLILLGISIWYFVTLITKIFLLNFLNKVHVQPLHNTQKNFIGNVAVDLLKKESQGRENK